MFGTNVAFPHIKAQRLVPLAVTESGLPGYEVTSWNALFAPAAIDRIRQPGRSSIYVTSIPENAEFDCVIVHHLPGVGENLSDHPNTRLTFECSQPITINDVLRSPWLKFKEGLKFAFKRGGLLSISSSTVQTAWHQVGTCKPIFRRSPPVRKARI